MSSSVSSSRTDGRRRRGCSKGLSGYPLCRCAPRQIVREDSISMPLLCDIRHLLVDELRTRTSSGETLLRATLSVARTHELLDAGINV